LHGKQVWLSGSGVKLLMSEYPSFSITFSEILPHQNPSKPTQIYKNFKDASDMEVNCASHAMRIKEK
jgi:hypothetical protein